jgi:hypothetical protein
MAAQFNQILILDSIPAGEYNTARALQDDLMVRAAVAPGGGPAIVRLRIDSAGHFVDIMSQCAEVAGREPYVPLVHLECHGSLDGIEFADRTSLTWLQVKDVLTPLNVATRLNLILVISACHGMAFASAVYVTDPAPVYAFIGPSRDMQAQELLTGFLAFYDRYLQTRSSEEGAEALRQTAEQGAFIVLSSRTIFCSVIERYRQQECHPDVLIERARGLQMRARAMDVEIDIDEAAAALGHPGWDEHFRQKFFMIDRYPENDARFPLVSAEGAA